MNKIKLQSILDASITKNAIFGTVACIHKGEETWLGASGNLTVQQPYFIASTTKLYVTAILLDLQQQNKLSLHDPIAPFLPPFIVNGLHVYNGTDYSNTLTIAQLLSNTSGLPDYFEDNKANGKSLLEELTTGRDRSWTFEEAIALAKTMKPKFAPGQKGKAHYSDTNFQLLEKIVETITGTTFETALEKSILHPLGLKNTYLFNNPDDTLPATVYYKNKPHNIPKAMSSFRADGGIVSTAGDTMTFIKAFFNGYFFPKEYLQQMLQWNRVMFPLEYGLGIMRFKLPGIFSPFSPMPEFIGHSGLSGAFAYYCPSKDTYITGTVNQIHNPGLSYRLMLRLVNKL